MARLDGSEKVLVIPEQTLDQLGRFQGFRLYHRSAHGELFDTLLENALFIPRTGDLEHGPGGLALKQLIPYGILTRRGSVFAFRRPRKGGDPRLRERASIGLGGHVNPVDGPGPGLKIGRISQLVLQNGMMRELHEEVRVASLSLHFAGLLNDDGNDVGRRHLGVVYRCEAGDAAIVPCRSEIEPLGWFTPEQLRESLAETCEAWSAIAIRHLEAIAGHPAAVAT